MIFGIDYAVVNEYVKDWPGLKAQLDFQFAFFRLTQGYNIYDNVYTIKAAAEGARSVDMLTAGWHQFDPTQSVQVQMDNFFRSWDTQKFELPPILAVESNKYQPAWALVPANQQADMLERCVEISKSRVSNPMMYTREEYWDSHVQQRPLWGTLTLWGARYVQLNSKQAPTMLTPWADGYYKFRDWPNPVGFFWQYTDKGLFPAIVVSPTNYGLNANIDLNGFSKTRADLEKLRISAAPEPEPIHDHTYLENAISTLVQRMDGIEKVDAAQAANIAAAVERINGLETAGMELEKDLTAETELGRLRTDRIKAIEDVINKAGEILRILGA